MNGFSLFVFLFALLVLTRGQGQIGATGSHSHSVAVGFGDDNKPQAAFGTSQAFSVGAGATDSSTASGASVDNPVHSESGSFQFDNTGGR